MKISFKVIDTRNGKDITKERFWVISSDGKLYGVSYYDSYDIIQAESFITYTITIEE